MTQKISISYVFPLWEEFRNQDGSRDCTSLLFSRVVSKRPKRKEVKKRTESNEEEQNETKECLCLSDQSKKDCEDCAEKTEQDKAAMRGGG